ncbi:MAG: DUF4416 family protein [PVC group bacterium]|nr:DUF4416 family protein [PVC group bacterium]
MGFPVKHEKVKLIIGLIGKKDLFDSIQKILTKKFGLIDFESDPLEFNFTNYYESEMGAGLKRKFLSFKKEIKPLSLPDIKLYTNKIEKKFLNSSGKRRVNIDPGYLSLSKLVLATTKDHQHRLYINKGIFAEVTLRYRDKTFTHWEWTYQDYCTVEYIKIFNHIRNNFIKRKKRKIANV